MDDVVGDGDGRRGDGEGVRLEATVRVSERTLERVVARGTGGEATVRVSERTDSFAHSLARSFTRAIFHSLAHSFTRTVDGECGLRAGDGTREWEEERAENEDESAREAREGRG